MKANPPPNRPKHLPTLLEAPRAKRSLQLQGRSKAEEYESADLCAEESCETNDQKFGKTSGLCAPTKSQDNTNQQNIAADIVSGLPYREAQDKSTASSVF